MTRDDGGDRAVSGPLPEESEMARAGWTLLGPPSSGLKGIFMSYPFMSDPNYKEPDPNCPYCGGSGWFTPWDTPIAVRCDCTYPAPTTTYPTTFGTLFTPRRNGV